MPHAIVTEAKNETVGGDRDTGGGGGPLKKMDLASSAFAFEPLAARPSSSLAQANRLSAWLRKCLKLKHGCIFMVSSKAARTRDRIVEAEGNKEVIEQVTVA
jgi:hypothetical protein